MRALNRVVDAARRNEDATESELRMAIAAQDILLAKAIEALKGAEAEDLLREYFKASSMGVDKFVGWENSPENQDFVKWHRQRTLEASKVGSDGS